MNHRD